MRYHKISDSYDFVFGEKTCKLNQLQDGFKATISSGYFKIKH